MAKVMCTECGGSGIGPDRINGNEVYQDKCTGCDGMGQVWEGGTPNAFPDAPEPAPESLRITVDADAVYCVLGRHRHKKDLVVIWTGVLGWVPLADMIPGQLVDWQHAVQLRAVHTSKFELNVIRMVAPAGKSAIILQ